MRLRRAAVWVYLESQKQVRPPKSADELWKDLHYICNNLSADFFL